MNQRMTPEEITEALSTDNQAVVGTLYSLGQSLYASEFDRAKIFDVKASALLALIALFTSFAFLLLERALLVSVRIGSEILGYFALWIFVFFGALQLFCIWRIFQGVKIRSGAKAPDERVIFEAVQLHDGHDLPVEQPRTDHNFKRYLVEHFWKLYQVRFDENELKAKHLLASQIGIFTGLVGLVFAQAILSFF